MTDDGRPAWSTWLGLVLLPTAVGAVLRAQPVFASSFPLNDGGLFYTMTDDLIRNGFGLPAVTSYNQAGIPFAYPPGAFYLAAALHGAFSIGLLDLMRFIPLIASILTVPAMWLVAREITQSGMLALGAAFAYAVAPRSYEWLTTGGGLTRAPGTLMVLLVAYAGLRLIRRASAGNAILLGVLGGATALLHPESALFAAATVIVFWLFAAARLRILPWLALSAGVALVTVSPWLAAVAAHNGLGVLLGAGSSASDPMVAVLQLASLHFTGAETLDVVLVLGLVGTVRCLATRDFMPVAWFAVMFLLGSRTAASYAMPGLAILAAYGMVVLVTGSLRPASGNLAGRPVRRVAAILAALLVLGAAGSYVSLLEPASPAHAVTSDELAAMRWTGENTPATARFLVVTGSDWSVDAVAEWFPSLTGRVSVATVQGYEWFGRETFDDRLTTNSAVQDCALESDRCVDAVATSLAFDYVFLPKGRFDGPLAPADCCPGLRATLVSSPRYRLVYDGAGASILERVE